MEIFFQDKPYTYKVCVNDFDHVSFKDIGNQLRSFFLKNAICGKCKNKFRHTEPYCDCTKIKDVILVHSLRDAYWEERYIEHKRIRAKFSAERYKEKKNSAEGVHTRKDIEQIYKLQNGLCYYCLEKVGHSENEKKYEADHFIPWSTPIIESMI